VDDEDIRGRQVKARDGEDLGEVDDLLIDPTENKVRFLVVASGGFLGLGQEKSFIPVDAVSGITAGEVHLDQTRDKVAGAPAYDPDIVEERSYYEDVYGYFGYAPYWAPGYVYPGYAPYWAPGYVYPGYPYPYPPGA
jgi:sporulation protein YlmC with PRC-barrel domain